MPETASGYFPSGLPYNRFGRGPVPLVVFQGLQFENGPVSGLHAVFVRGLYKKLEAHYTVYVVTRRPGLAPGCSLADMARDYAATVRAEFDPPVDVIGLSTGGLIVQHFAADHPGLVRRLVLHSSACRLGDEARAFQTYVGQLAGEGRWREAHIAVFEFMSKYRRSNPRLARLAARLAAPLGRWLLGQPESASDLLVTYAASNEHEFRERLSEIVAPTLVVAGDRDPFYPAELVRETAEGIPGGAAILYPGIGHPASGPRFSRDLLSFLKPHA